MDETPKHFAGSLSGHGVNDDVWPEGFAKVNFLRDDVKLVTSLRET